MVPCVAQAVENGLAGLSWRPDVQGFAGGQLGARGYKMQLRIPFVGVPNPKNVVLVAVKASKCRLLEVVHDLLLLGLGGIVSVGKRDNAGGVFPFATGAVDQLNRPLWITSQHFGGWVTPDQLASTDAELVILRHHFIGAVHDRRTTSPCAVCEEPDYCHGLSKARNSRSMTSRTDST